MGGERVLICEGLCLSLNGREILMDITARFEPGRYHALIGPNGSGKTTLLAALSGFLKPDAGCARYSGRDVHRMGYRERARHFSVVQQRETASMPFTGLEMVLLGLTPHLGRLGGTGEADVEIARSWMEQTGALDFCDQPVQKLSGGEFQRVVLARALAQKPEVLFLDEALSEMDVRARLQMLKLLRGEIVARGLTVVAVHHDLSTALTAADHVLALSGGRSAACGETRAVVTEELIRDVFGVRSEIHPGKGILIREAIENQKERGDPP
jgi:iron complex transport system ATP-binding protein